MPFVAIKMGRRQGARSGASRTIFTLLQIWYSPAGIKMVRDATDEQRSRRPIFIATLRAAASWLFSALLAPFVSVQICSSLAP